jgi:glycosyltransferase involved in cell wall biosynthesis
MTNETISKLEKSIEILKDKKQRIYFMVLDTKGNAKASIAMIYRTANVLFNEGYNVSILHEKNDYVGVSGWLGDEYMKLPHKSLENQNLEISPEDFLIIPEIFGYVMPQVSKLPCAKIVFSQAYDHIMETLQPGESWSQLGFTKCITTSENQRKYLDSIMKGVSFDIVEPVISESFTKQLLPPKPIFAIHTRDQRDTANFIKTFYVKYPQYRWVTFRDMRGLSEKEFANALSECFCSVWMDPTSSFGTFPLESMKCGVPVIGLAPSMTSEWMNEDNGIWVGNRNQVLDVMVEFLHNWLEDNIADKLYEGMEKTASQFSNMENFTKSIKSLFERYTVTRLGNFQEQLNKLQETETIK